MIMENLMQNKQQLIEHKLQQTFTPDYLEVINESSQHNVPPDSESHFKVIIVASGFERLGLVKRHQAVYSALAQLMQEGVHALALHTLSPREWQAKNKQVKKSPPCLGGSTKAS